MSGVEEAAAAAAIMEGASGAAAAGGAAAGAGAAGAAGAGALGAGAAGAGAGVGAGLLAGTAAEGAGAAGTGLLATAPEAAGTMAYVTPSVTGGLEGATASTPALDAIAASQPGYLADGSALDAIAASQPGYTAASGEAAMKAIEADQALGGYAGTLKGISKAGSAYNAVNSAAGAGQPQRGAPAARPIFQGEAPQIARQQTQPHENQFARMLLEQRKRGMLG